MRTTLAFLLLSVCFFPFGLSGCADAGNDSGATDISLTETEIGLVLGETHRLVAEVRPAGAAISWSSSNPEVAFVDREGLVTANIMGETVITAYSGDVSASCRVTVTGQKAESVVLNVEQATLLVGDTLRLTATVLPEDTYNTVIAWSSDNEQVATVSADGLVTALSSGNAVITSAIDGVSAECAVTVAHTPQVGYYFYDDGTYSYEFDSSKEVIGIIFYVNEDKMSGKIIEINQTSLPWGIGGVVLDNGDRYDGKGNTENILEYISDNDAWSDFPAFEYIDNLNAGGLDWYMPSAVELKQLYCAMSGVKWVDSNPGEGEVADWSDTDTPVLTDSEYRSNRDTFNERVVAAGGTAFELSYSYWSSTSIDMSTAYQIILNHGIGYMIIREGNNRVRGVAEF